MLNVSKIHRNSSLSHRQLNVCVSKPLLLACIISFFPERVQLRSPARTQRSTVTAHHDTRKILVVTYECKHPFIDLSFRTRVRIGLGYIRNGQYWDTSVMYVTDLGSLDNNSVSLNLLHVSYLILTNKQYTCDQHTPINLGFLDNNSLSRSLLQVLYRQLSCSRMINILSLTLAE